MEQKVNSHIGKKLLDMLMFSMYPDAKIIYREYVQNAFDSINSAVEQKILNKTKDGIKSLLKFYDISIISSLDRSCKGVVQLDNNKKIINKFCKKNKCQNII